MLSFERGIPIARIEGGKDDGKILRIYEAKEAEHTIPDIQLSNSDIFDLLPEDYFRKKRKQINLKELMNIKAVLQKGIDPINKELKNICEQAKKDLTSKLMREYTICDHGRFLPLPRNEENQRDSLYVSGPSGSGKSTFTANYLKEFQRMFPKRKIFLFSRVDEDKPLDDIKNLKRIPIDEELVEDPIELEELELSCCIFDDVDTIADKSLKTAISELRTDILQTGRHFGQDKKSTSKGIYCISTSHMLTNYKETRELLNEANKVVCFPKSGGAAQIKYFFQKYAGLNPKQIEEIFNLEGRWVMLSKHHPQYILSEKKVFLLGK